MQFAEYTGVRLHVVHVSTAAGLRLVADAAPRGVAVSAETCPHYLLLDHSDLVRLGGWARCAPPLREPEEVERVWACVLEGIVTALASDHSPYTITEKAAGESNIFDAPMGLNVIQSMIPAVLGEAVHKRGMALEKFAALTATGPARLIGVYPQKGAVKVGSDGDVVIWDMDKEWRVSNEELFSKHRWTPLAGRKIKGAVDMTIRRGEIVYEKGTIKGAPGSGRFLSWSLLPKDGGVARSAPASSWLN